MKIKKILNNNTAVIDDNGNEVIVIGKGICFQHKAGAVSYTHLRKRLQICVAILEN